MDKFCNCCGMQLESNIEIVRKGKRVCKRCASKIDAIDKQHGRTISGDWEEVLQMLSEIKKQARDKGKNVLIEDVCIDSFYFVINSAMELIQYEND